MTVKRMIDVDHLPREYWPLDESTTLVWNRMAWNIEPVGRCASCADLDRPTTIASTDDESRSIYFCVIHGWLIEIPCRISKHIEIKLADLGVRDGYYVNADIVLIPANIEPEQRRSLLENLLNDIQAEEMPDNI